MKTIPLTQDTRSNQKFTKEKLATMRPGDIAAVASARGYDVHPSTGRISHSSFLAQQDESKQFEGDEGHTESGSVPDEHVGNESKPNFHDVSSTGDSVHGGRGGLPPAEPMPNMAGEGFKGVALGEATSTEEHSGTVSESGTATLGAIEKPQEDEKGVASEPLVNVPAPGQSEVAATKP